jgi:outer membrane protein OmpA-like peptidoglycan-associated protein
VAATLRANDQIQLLQVQGHADERGNDDHNLQLTRDRAASVVAALVQRGVAAERLHAAGYGERCPLNPGRGPVAWAANRLPRGRRPHPRRGPRPPLRPSPTR